MAACLFFSFTAMAFTAAALFSHLASLAFSTPCKSISESCPNQTLSTQSLDITAAVCYYLAEFCEVADDLGVRFQLISAQVSLQVMSKFLGHTNLVRRLLLELFEAAAQSRFYHNLLSILSVEVEPDRLGVFDVFEISVEFLGDGHLVRVRVKLETSASVQLNPNPHQVASPGGHLPCSACCSRPRLPWHYTPPSEQRGGETVLRNDAIARSLSVQEKYARPH